MKTPHYIQFRAPFRAKLWRKASKITSVAAVTAAASVAAAAGDAERSCFMERQRGDKKVRKIPGNAFFSMESAESKSLGKFQFLYSVFLRIFVKETPVL